MVDEKKYQNNTLLAILERCFSKKVLMKMNAQKDYCEK